MYQLIQAQTRAAGTFNNWTETDVADVRLVTLFQKYGACLLYLYDETNDQNGWLDVYQLPTSIRDSVATVSAWLAVADGLTLVLDDPFAERGDNYVRFLNAVAYLFTLRGTNANFSEDESLLPDQKIDILCSRAGVTDYTSLVSKTLWTVNGLCFRAWPIDGTGVSLNGAGRFAAKINDARVGILDFSNIGTVSTYPITTDMFQTAGDGTMYRGFFLTTPESLTGKTVGLVLGGKVYFLDNALQVAGETRVKINMPNISLINQWYETYKYLDWSALPLTPDANDVDQTVANQFIQDAVIRAFFTSAYSFLFIVDATNLTREHVPLKRTHIDGTYLSGTQNTPDLPCQIGAGWLAEYNLFEQDGFWALRLPHSQFQQWFYETIPMSDRQLVQSMRYGYKPTMPADARFLLIKKVAST